MHLSSHLLPRQSIISPLNNRARPMANAGQAPHLEGIHLKMHGIVEEIRIMNGINAHLVQHHVTNNPPTTTALVPKDVDRSRRSHRSGNQDWQNHHSASQGHSTRSH